MKTNAPRPEHRQSFDLARQPADIVKLPGLFAGFNHGAEFTVQATEFDRPTTVVLSEHDPDVLPALFRGQRAFGSAVHIDADNQPRSAVRVTVPYEPKAIRELGVAPADLVVLALDDAKTAYRELRPIEVEKQRGTLTVLTDRFSYLFVGTPSIRLHGPELYRSSIGELVAYTNRFELHIYGEVGDESAEVAVDGVTANRGPAGWFGLSVALPDAGERTVELSARVNNRVPHSASFLVRRHPLPKRVATVAHLYGHEIVVDRNNRPFVSHTVNTVAERDDIEALLSQEWDLLMSDHELELAVPTVNGVSTSWSRVRVSGLELHEQVAASVIRVYNDNLLPTMPPIESPATPGAGALVRLGEFLSAQSENWVLVAVVYGLWRQQRRRFGAGTLAYSPTAPVVSLDEVDEIGLAYVHATDAGLINASSSGLSASLQALHAYTTPVKEQTDDEETLVDLDVEPTAVGAGDLVYVTVDPHDEDGPTRSQPEVVAKDVWCSRIAMQLDPATGQPVIAAIGVAPDIAGAPRSRLMLYRRQQDGAWRDTLIDESQAYVDVDLALESRGAPRIVAAVSTTPAGGFQLFEINAARGGGGWEIQPLLWSLPGVAPSNGGACPRILIEDAPSNHSVIAFVADVAAAPRYIAGIKRGRTWSFVEVATITVADVFGAPSADTDAQTANQVIRASGQSLFHFSPAITSVRRNQVHYAYGSSVLTLVTIDTDLGVIQSRESVDVDRTTGIAPAITRRPNSTSALVYQDFWGNGPVRSFIAGKPLHYFSRDSGPLVPGGAEPADAPMFARTRVDLTPLGTYRGLHCERLTEPSLADENIRSVIFHKRFELLVFPEGSGPLPWVFGYWYTHNRTADMIWRLPRRTPAINQLSVHSTSAADDIDRIDILIPGVLLEVPLKTEDVDALNAGQFPLWDDFIRNRLAIRRLLDGGPDVEVRTLDANVWEVVANDPFNQGDVDYVDGSKGSPPSIRYTLTAQGNQIAVSMQPIISITQPTDPDPRPVGNYLPCGFTQGALDAFSGGFAGEINRVFDIDLGEDFGADTTIESIRLLGVSVFRAAWVAGSGQQQGAFRMSLSIPQIVVHGSQWVVIKHVGFRAQTQSSSDITLEIAPFVTDEGRVQWYLRRVSADISPLDVDVDVGFGDAVLLALLGSGLSKAVLNLVSPSLSGLGATASWAALFGDLIADPIATDVVNARGLEFDTRGIVSFVLDIFNTYTERLQAQPGRSAVEACFLSGSSLQLVTRQYFEEGAPDWSIVGPTGFGVLTAGQAPVVRTAFVQNFASVPVVIVSAVLEDSGRGFALVDPPVLPVIVRPGETVDFRMAFDPAVLGEQRTNFVVTDVADRRVQSPLAAAVVPPSAPLPPRIEVVPRNLNFGPVTANTRPVRTVRISNTGAGELTVQSMEIDSPLFSVNRTAPFFVTVGGAVDVEVAFDADGQAGNYSATLSIGGNDPDRPSFDVHLAATILPGADIRISPTAIAFPPFPVDPSLPPIAGQYRALQIHNAGVMPVTVLGPSFRVLNGNAQVSTEFLILAGDSSNPTPHALDDVTIRPGELLELTVRFRPTAIGTASGSIAFAFGGSTPPVLVPVTGEGI
jgi:hypothetical protein